MKYWTPRLLSEQSSKHAVKLSQLKLELGLFGARGVAAANDKIAIEITGTVRRKEKTAAASSSSSSSSSKASLSLLPFHRTPKGRCTHTTSARRFLGTKAPSLVWDARDLCGFHLVLKDGSLGACDCDITFHVLYGEGGVGESKSKMAVIGNILVSVTMAELLVREEMKTGSNHRLHSVSLSLLKLRNSHDDSPGTFEISVVSEKKHGIIGKVKYLTSLRRKKNGSKFDQTEQPSPYESDGSPVFDSDDSSNESTTSSGSSSSSNNRIHTGRSRLVNGSERFTNSEKETRLDSLHRTWSQSSRNRNFKGWSFEKRTRKQENLTFHSGPFTKSDTDNNCCWEIKEFSSRDGKSKLKTNVFFASFDQRSEQASGESACTALVTFIAHWLHFNQDIMPTRAQFDSLITQGSSEWRRLCNSDDYLKLFPDKHFDLETVIEAKLRPLIVVSQKSYTGFFSPEKFQLLKGAMSFDEIWDEINSNDNVVDDYEARIYIVSWNDHFFVLKVEADAYYIIDTLGERLFEGCQQAFILKFDDLSVMYGKAEEEALSKERSGNKSEKGEEERVEIVYNGKECCKEFIKRFLAGITVQQLEKEEKKGNANYPYLHRQLQIDFHYSSSTSSSSSSSTSVSSFFSSGPLEA